MHRKGWAFEELFDYFMKYKMKWQDRGFDTPILNKTVKKINNNKKNTYYFYQDLLVNCDGIQIQKG